MKVHIFMLMICDKQFVHLKNKVTNLYMSIGGSLNTIFLQTHSTTMISTYSITNAKLR